MPHLEPASATAERCPGFETPEQQLARLRAESKALRAAQTKPALPDSSASIRWAMLPQRSSERIR
ncbi:hypothetical protein [Mycobacterium camsae]|uniref:hypothetical protein n=1 Tax=Mycobacterium gordonae TaxID=1778 RepID=UPI001F120DE2|nr:hypothetical protein [Mycobacterium gordonae]